MSEFGIYALFRPDGRICYVGKGRSRRPRDHFRASYKQRNRHLSAIIRQGGGRLDVDWLATGLTEVAALAEEKRIIALIGRVPRGPLVNLTDGGEGLSGHQFTPEHRSKIKAASSNPSPEARKKMSDANKGRVASPETRAKISAARKGRPTTLGKVMSPETKAKISAAQFARHAAKRVP